MLSVKDIQKIQNTKNSLRKEIYKKILESFSKKIRTYVEMEQTQIFLTVPVMIVGYPSFDRKVARDYLIRQLKNLGYTVIPYQDFEIYVTWAVRPTSEAPEPEIGLPAFVNLHKVADLYRNKKR
jgi:hypothetical protein